MKAITLRNMPPELSRIIQKKAKEQGTSINKTVIALLKEYTGIQEKKTAKPLYDDLEHLAGSWSKEDAIKFDQTLAKQRKIDPSLWK